MEITNQLKYSIEKMKNIESLQENVLAKINANDKLTAVFLPSNFEGDFPQNTESTNFIPTTRESLLNLIKEEGRNHCSRIRYAKDEVGEDSFLQSLIIAKSTWNLENLSQETVNMLMKYANEEKYSYDWLSLDDVIWYYDYIQSLPNISWLSWTQNVVVLLNDFENQRKAILSRKNTNR